jgi:hypothetical protein
VPGQASAGQRAGEAMTVVLAAVGLTIVAAEFERSVYGTYTCVKVR